MLRRILCVALLLTVQGVSAQGSEYFRAAYGELLPGSSDRVGLWWTSSGWKIGRDKTLPEA